MLGGGQIKELPRFGQVAFTKLLLRLLALGNVFPDRLSGFDRRTFFVFLSRGLRGEFRVAAPRWS